MKVSIERIPTVLLAALLMAGCTVNIQTTPGTEPNPPAAEDEAEGPLVSPTHNPERRDQPVRRDTTSRIDPTRQPVRRVPDAVITRREEPPTQSQDSVTVVREDDEGKDHGGRSNPEHQGKENDAQGGNDDTPHRSGVGARQHPAVEQAGAESRPTAASNGGGRKAHVLGEAGAEDMPAAPGSSLGISTKDLPPTGKCRVWIPGRDAADQAKAGKCDVVEASAPSGSWVLYRSAKDRTVVRVRVIDAARPGSVSEVRSYDIASGKLIRGEQ